MKFLHFAPKHHSYEKTLVQSNQKQRLIEENYAAFDLVEEYAFFSFDSLFSVLSQNFIVSITSTLVNTSKKHYRNIFYGFILCLP